MSLTAVAICLVVGISERCRDWARAYARARAHRRVGCRLTPHVYCMNIQYHEAMTHSSIRSPRVYLAGPDVFDREAALTFAQLSTLAQLHGLAAIVPMEGWGQVAAAPGEAGPALARRIFAANIERLNRADGVIANLRDFRGTEPDSGTVFEVGYAHARGIPVIGYGVPPIVYSRKVREYLPCVRDGQGTLREQGSGREVEDFGQPLNLMLACSVALAVDARAAMAAMAARLLG